MASPFPSHRVSLVLNSAAAGRRLALRAVAYQMAAVVLVALVFLIQGSIKAVNGEEYRYPLTLRFVS